MKTTIKIPKQTSENPKYSVSITGMSYGELQAFHAMVSDWLAHQLVDTGNKATMYNSLIAALDESNPAQNVD